MFILTRERLLEAVTKMRRAVCAYGPNAQECDCKYGASAVGHMSTGSEETGCPELRSIELLLKGLGDHEYDKAMNQSGPSEYELLYSQAILKWGTRAQVDMAIEECSELIMALEHFRRGRMGEFALCREIADVINMMGQLRLIFGPSYVDQAIKSKMERLAERLNSSGPAPVECLHLSEEWKLSPNGETICMGCSRSLGPNPYVTIHEEQERRRAALRDALRQTKEQGDIP